MNLAVNKLHLRLAIAEAFQTRMPGWTLVDATLDRLVAGVIEDLWKIEGANDARVFARASLEIRKMQPFDEGHALAILPMNRSPR